MRVSVEEKEKDLTEITALFLPELTAMPLSRRTGSATSQKKALGPESSLITIPVLSMAIPLH